MLDCLEFDDHLRHVDVLHDVAFLAMDLEHSGPPRPRRAASSTLRRVLRRARARGPAPPLRGLPRARAGQGRLPPPCAGRRPGRRRRARTAAARRSTTCERGAVRLALVGGCPAPASRTVRCAGRPAGAGLLPSDRLRKELAGLPYEASAAAPSDEALYGHGTRRGDLRRAARPGRDVAGPRRARPARRHVGRSRHQGRGRGRRRGDRQRAARAALRRAARPHARPLARAATRRGARLRCHARRRDHRGRPLRTMAGRRRDPDGRSARGERGPRAGRGGRPPGGLTG